ncbi:hypothetical protein RRG08_060137 [Elysia crispata]|uniref:Uncharacterized protein n=1 Tax=Elysia crispata TaxID=231223 RepID=A0AAE0ZZ99_9GAST|nr:hypothetical protein RRG08_060137 [Elysia crispata]
MDTVSELARVLWSATDYASGPTRPQVGPGEIDTRTTRSVWRTRLGRSKLSDTDQYTESGSLAGLLLPSFPD